MKKEINLGYLSIADWKPGDRLFGDWMYGDEEYADEIRDAPADEIVLPPNTDYTLKIDYPLKNPFVFQFTTGPAGMQRKELVELVVDSYHRIYDEEDASVGYTAGNFPGMFNRRTTDGKYGIWGHCLDDLMVGAAFVDEGNVVTLAVDS